MTERVKDGFTFSASMISLDNAKFEVEPILLPKKPEFVERTQVDDQVRTIPVQPIFAKRELKNQGRQPTLPPCEMWVPYANGVFCTLCGNKIKVYSCH